MPNSCSSGYVLLAQSPKTWWCFFRYHNGIYFRHLVWNNNVITGVSVFYSTALFMLLIANIASVFTRLKICQRLLANGKLYICSDPLKHGSFTVGWTFFALISLVFLCQRPYFAAGANARLQISRDRLQIPDSRGDLQCCQTIKCLVVASSSMELCECWNSL